MLVSLALSTAAAQAQALTGPTIVDFSEDFESYGNDNSFSGAGGWLTQYTQDAWETRGLNGVGTALFARRDDGSNGPGWGGNRPQDDMLVQIGNRCGPADDRACAWGTVQLDTDFFVGEGNGADGLGVVFSWVDANDFWLFVMSRDRMPRGSGADDTFNGSRLIHVVNGVGAETFDNAALTYASFSRGHLTVLADGGNLQVWLDRDDTGLVFANERVFDVRPNTGIPSGRVGPYCYDNGGFNNGVPICAFDEVTVRIKDTDADGRGDPYDNCPTVANVDQANLDGDALGDVCDPDQDGDGVTAAGGDCADRDKSRFPGATEVCDGVDQDCDGVVDDGAAGSKVWYADADGDKAGNSAVSTTACTAPTGYVPGGGDCNDADATAYPGASEVCDGVDDDCDNVVDDSPIDGTTWYTDADQDGYGGVSIVACSQPAGSIAGGGDCDDADAKVHPGVTEVCDGVDQDCDGLVDDGATDIRTWYADLDGDGYGDPATGVSACTPPPGHVDRAGDCYDGDRLINPGVEERCDGIDADCDGTVDDNAADAPTWYVDGDKDGLGDDGSTVASCMQPPGTAAVGGDCDDADATVGGGEAWFADADLDGFGDAGDVVIACDAPAGFVGDATDCEDADRAVNPAAEERCSTAGLDDDCDGQVDEADAVDVSDWYTDADRDGFGTDGSAVAQCAPPTGASARGGDCVDADAEIYPGAPEACDDPVDRNCDGAVGDVDGDGDGVVACEDCDDGDASAFPGGAEVCDGVDNDCDGAWDGPGAAGATAWYADADGDQHGDPTVSAVECAAPYGYVGAADDCDDGDDRYHPGADEACDDPDFNCDGSTGLIDLDGDGFAACEECDDGEAGVNPDAVEVCNGVDDDCVGGVDESGEVWFVDADGDGFGDPSTAGDTCPPPEGAVGVAGDCDDADPAVHEGADEVPDDGVDQDCDGEDLTGGDTDDTGGPDDTDVEDTGLSGTYQGGCGCDHGGVSPAWAGLAALLLGSWRRRPSPRRSRAT